MTDAEKIKVFAQKIKLTSDTHFSPEKTKQLCDMVTQMADDLENREDYDKDGYAIPNKTLTKLAEGLK